MKLTISLGVNQEDQFDIELKKNNFVQKWVKEFEWCLDNCDFNQHEAFAGLQSLETAQTKLIHACETINKYFKKNFIEIKSDKTQTYYNYLHEKFEQLSGEFGKPTKLFTIANSELKQAIRNLNFYVHRVEKQKEILPNLYISFDKNQYRRWPLVEDDYEHMNFILPAGTLFLHYAELGKEFLDLYQDNLPINYKNFRNLHYYSGEATITFKEINIFEDNNYLIWLKSNNIDPYDKKLGHGRIALGQVMDVQSVLNKVQKYQHLNKITIKD